MPVTCSQLGEYAVCMSNLHRLSPDPQDPQAADQTRTDPLSHSSLHVPRRMAQTNMTIGQHVDAVQRQPSRI